MRRPRLAYIADVIKNATIFIKITFKDSKKVRIEVDFLGQQRLLTSSKKILIQQNSRGASRDLYIFLDLL